MALASFTMLAAATPAAADHLDYDALIKTFGSEDDDLVADGDDGDDDNSTGSAGESGDNGASTSAATAGTSVGTGGATTGAGDPCGPADTDDTSHDGTSHDGDTSGGDSNDTSGDGNSNDGDSGNDDSDDTSGDGGSFDGDSGDESGDEGDDEVAEVCAPGIAVDKSAAESSVGIGGTINYTVVVRNTGNSPLTVTPVDQACAGFDGAVFILAPGATKTLTCSHVASETDGTAYRNEACAGGVTAGGHVVSDCGDVTTPITPPQPPPADPPAEQTVLPESTSSDPGGQLVLGERIIPGRARLIGATGCRGKAFSVRVVGRQMAAVTFRLDGRVVKRVSRAGSRATLRINPLRLSVGVHRLVATVRFNRSSRTRARTLRLSFQRCARALQAPRFTG